MSAASGGGAGAAKDTAIPTLDDRPQATALPIDPIKTPSAFAQITSNPFFTAGIGLAGFGAVLAAGRKGIVQIATLVKRRLLVDVEINVKDDTYNWFLHWMTVQHRSLANGHVGEGNISRGQRLLHRFTPRLHHLSVKTDITVQPNGSFDTQFYLLPGLGKHILRYKNALLMVERAREMKSTNLADGKPWETVTLTTLYSQRHILEELFREAHALAIQSTQGKTVIYTAHSTSWELFGQPRRKRPLSSVILREGVKERILRDVEEFLASESWYRDRGIPYRRGYLLYGSPGSGKSSFIQALAAELNYNIAMVNLSERGLTDDRLNYLLSVIPRRSLALLEDADAAFANRRTQIDGDGYRGANVTFSGLLNALDGVASAEERLLFLTTNHIDRLDAALIRPGRVDMTVEVGAATRSQAAELWNRFFGDTDVHGKGRTRFLRRLEELDLLGAGSGVSMAALQGLFLYNKNDMEGAINMVKELHQPTR